MLIKVFISCRLDYCNSLVYGIAEGLISRLQSVKNAAARLVSGARHYDHISRCYRSCTGFRFDVGQISRWPLWSTCHCSAQFQLIWPPTASWSPTKVVLSCVLSHQGRVLSDGPIATRETGVLQLQVRNCVTAFQLIFDKMTLTSNDLNGY